MKLSSFTFFSPLWKSLPNPLKVPDAAQSAFYPANNLACSFDQCRQVNFLSISGMVKISLDYWEQFTQSWLCITVIVNVYRLEKTWRVRSGQGTWTRPDPPGSGPDPTRPAILVHIPDPTQPDPTRPAGRPDPGTTLCIGPLVLWISGLKLKVCHIHVCGVFDC